MMLILPQTKFYSVIFCTLLFLLLSSCNYFYSDPETVAEDYVEAIYEGNVGKFKKLVEESDYNKTSDYKLFISGASTGRLKTSVLRDGVASISAVEATLGKNTATVKVDVVFNNQSRKTLNISLHYANERWYVSPMSWPNW